jgi:hypothetical protein
MILPDYWLPRPFAPIDRDGLALHGSGNPAIDIFEPRQPVDLNAFGNQKAVFAAADGIWAMFFAIVDRDRFSMSVNNACIRVVGPANQTSEAHYVFSVSREILGIFRQSGDPLPRTVAILGRLPVSQNDLRFAASHPYGTIRNTDSSTGQPGTRQPNRPDQGRTGRFPLPEPDPGS